MRDRVSILRWIACGVRQDLVFGAARGNAVYRTTLSVLLYLLSLVCIAFVGDYWGSLNACVEVMDRTIPSFSLFVTMLSVAFLAWVMTRIALVVMFIDRPFAGMPNPR